MSSLKIRNPDTLHAALHKLHDHEDPTDWVLISYVDRDEVQLDSSGNGGLEELKAALDPKLVSFAILGVQIEGDEEYNPVKHVLITWLGPEVGSGLAKARAAAHRRDLQTVVNESVSISSQVQAESVDDLDAGQVSQSVTRMRAKYHSAQEVSSERQARSRSSAAGGGAHSRMEIVDRERCSEALLAVHDEGNDAVDWVILAYVRDRKDEIELVKSGGGGVEGLAAEWPTDRVYYGVIAITYETKGSRDPVRKYLLITMIGEGVKPLQRARSGAQRKDVANFVLSVVPFHAHYQPNEPEDLTLKNLLSKFND